MRKNPSYEGFMSFIKGLLILEGLSKKVDYGNDFFFDLVIMEWEVWDVVVGLIVFEEILENWNVLEVEFRVWVDCENLISKVRRWDKLSEKVDLVHGVEGLGEWEMWDIEVLDESEDEGVKWGIGGEIDGFREGMGRGEIGYGVEKLREKSSREVRKNVGVKGFWEVGVFHGGSFRKGLDFFPLDISI